MASLSRFADPVTESKEDIRSKAIPGKTKAITSSKQAEPISPDEEAMVKSAIWYYKHMMARPCTVYYNNCWSA